MRYDPCRIIIYCLVKVKNCLFNPHDIRMTINKKLLNVLLLGFGFMFVFTAFQTMGNIQKTILDSYKNNEDPNFNGDGYISLALIYAIFSLFNWSAPSIISSTGPRIVMIYGSITYLFFILTFLSPKTWLLYLASVIIGTGAALIWTGQGNYLTLNSTKDTISRNSGIFWALLQVSMFAGNLFVFFQFQGLTEIDKSTRNVTVIVLSVVAGVGVGIFLLLPKPQFEEGDIVEVQQSPRDAFIGAIKLFRTRKMLLLCFTFFYTGISLSFFSGVYSSCIGFTKQFGSQAKQLVGLSGIFIGLGEIIGGALFGILGSRFSRWGRDPIVIAGFIFHVAAYFITFLNLPNNSPFGDTDDKAFITSSPALAILCSFLLGFGDACYNTQVFSILGSIYADISASAFAIFKFVQSVATAASFFYASYVLLTIQLGILVFLAIVGTVTFVLVEYSVKQEQKDAQAIE
ncbi:UNC93-like protein MFSD11 [Agrilus planipennis]|uniref:UNC93-like protein MFSD11 n=1 Tax=Agrilus planipennis TaxID=224129 RepID=A0A1W4XD41_AGRPL|nr:UNC93-like protein MFSD11 [Agrilus planipennis]